MAHIPRVCSSNEIFGDNLPWVCFRRSYNMRKYVLVFRPICENVPWVYCREGYTFAFTPIELESINDTMGTIMTCLHPEGTFKGHAHYCPHSVNSFSTDHNSFNSFSTDHTHTTASVLTTLIQQLQQLQY